MGLYFGPATSIEPGLVALLATWAATTLIFTVVMAVLWLLRCRDASRRCRRRATL
jgi:hypothetical protein